MNSRQHWLVAVAAFAGGVLSGLLLAPESGQDVRRRVTRTARGSARWAGQRLHDVEDQLDALERQLQTLSAQLGQRLCEATQRAAHHYLPSAPADEAAWTLEGADLVRDLRRLPRQ